jgi:Calx-beta domain
MKVKDVRVVVGQTATTSAVFAVSLNEPALSPVSVSYRTADGTAKAGKGYLAAAGTLTIPAGSSVGTIAVQVVPHAFTGSQNFSLDLSLPSPNANIGDSRGVATLVNG